MANPSTNLLSPLVQSISLGLTQIAEYKVPERFKDSDNIVWTLEKEYTNSARELPDPNRVQITAVWNHAFLAKGNIENPIYVYVIEGILLPRTVAEKPIRVLFQWFSKTMVKEWNLASITPQEWLMANMYTASASDSRMSKLKALCKYTDEVAEPDTQPSVGLLSVPEITSTQVSKRGRKSDTNTNAGSAS